jgi:hypothetical protein
VQVSLKGSSWSGAGLEVSSSNGSVRLDLPDDYNAHLIARSTNGSMRVDRPITVQGRLGRDIDTNLGKGGAPLRVTTSNGSLTVR